MIIVNKAGHFHFREYPEEFNHNVIHFLRSREHQTGGGGHSGACRSRDGVGQDMVQ
jgi:hypothetical protein